MTTTTTIQSSATTLRASGVEFEVDEAQTAAVSCLARYSRRTLEAYRHDLRGFFQWATDHGIAVLVASRAHIELFRAWMEDRGLAAATIDRRLSTVCGFYRFAHIDGRIRSNPAQYVRRPQVHASDTRGLDRSELGVFLFTAEHYDRDHAGARRAARAKRAASQRGLCHQRRGPRHQARPSHTDPTPAADGPLRRAHEHNP
jgi:integrase